MAQALAEAGADVILVARGDLVRHQAKLVEAAGRKAFPFSRPTRPAALRWTGSLAALWRPGTYRWPDILVNNGGTIRRGAISPSSHSTPIGTR